MFKHVTAAGLFRRRRLLSDSLISNITGIYNPTICLQYDELMFFYVSNEHYPVYDSYVYDVITSLIAFCRPFNSLFASPSANC